MKISVLVVAIFLSAAVGSVHCQDDMWAKMKQRFADFIGPFREMWNSFTQELSKRMSGIREWTAEAWQSFKDTMADWINRRSDISETEKSEMKEYIERLQMPTNKSQKL